MRHLLQDDFSFMKGICPQCGGKFKLINDFTAHMAITHRQLLEVFKKEFLPQYEQLWDLQRNKPKDQKVQEMVMPDITFEHSRKDHYEISKIGLPETKGTSFPQFSQSQNQFSSEEIGQIDYKNDLIDIKLELLD